MYQLREHSMAKGHKGKRKPPIGGWLRFLKEVDNIQHGHPVVFDTELPVRDYEGTDECMLEADDLDAQWKWTVEAEHT